MKKVWFSIGAAVIVILLLLQTRFHVFMTMEESGYAVCDAAMKQTLKQDPAEVEGEPVFSYYRFETYDDIFFRGGRYYMGEKKKREIDLGFPLYVNGGAGIFFTGNAGTLFDVDYEESPVYRGLAVSDQVAYNPGGSRADAAEYLFCGMNNGFFVNLSTISYEDRGENRQIDMNSIVYFAEDYFSYVEHSGENGGEGRYQACANITEDMELVVGGRKIAYRELLLRLHVISEESDRVKNGKDPAGEEPPVLDWEVPEAESADDTGESAELIEDAEVPEEKADSAERGKDKTGGKLEQKNEKKAGEAEAAEKPEAAKPRPKREPASPGKRPDSMRPDKMPVKPDPVQGYVKPTVTVENVTAGVYRIILDVRVNDPANRLHERKKVEFEFYEVGTDGSEELVYHTYTGGSNRELTAGDGSIKPGTTYRINAYFTYYDEYNSAVVESIPLDALLTDNTITTKPIDTLGYVDMASPVPEYYYDNYLELPNVRYGDASDPEAVYGINRSGGIRLIVKGAGTGAKTTTLDGSTIRSFKKHLTTTFQSAAGLAAKSSYTFEIEAVDYFGNKVALLNNTGSFETCKARPAASLEIVKNQLGDFRMRVRFSDEDASAIKAAGGGYDIYLVYSTVRADQGAVTKEECDGYLANGGPVAGSKAAFVHKFTETEYLDKGVLRMNREVQTGNLDLNTRYYAYLYCDYDLNNKKGEVRFGEIAGEAFTSASLSSLGNIYIRTDISEVTYDSAKITYQMNTERTVDDLEKLLYTVRFDIVRSCGEEKVTDSYILFDTNAVTLFTGYDHGSNGAEKEFPWEKRTGGAGMIEMGKDFFTEGKISPDHHALKSMTEYKIVPHITALYNGKEYDMKVTMTNSSFKTMKKPAEVLIENMLMAGGTLRLQTKIEDPDGAIIGSNARFVTLTVYQRDNVATPVRTIRIVKNREEFENIVVRNLNPAKNYQLVFRAEEYNEGYTNVTYVSNKVLKDVYLTDKIKVTGTIKLRDITESDGALTANVKIDISDPDRELVKPETAEGCYHIGVEKDGTAVEGIYPESYPAEYDAQNSIVRLQPFEVDKGDHTYKLTLYAILSGYKLELDTLTFTAEQTVENINSEEEFIWKIRNNPTGKFAVTKDLYLDSETDYINPENKSEKTTPRKFTAIFNGTLDFQGYTLGYTMHRNDSYFFNAVGSKADISALVLDVTLDNAGSPIISEGALCVENHGHIHDIMMICRNRVSVDNYYMGLICDGNAAGGLIENFVIANGPDEGDGPITLRHTSGLICCCNYGTIRNGYIYGQDIMTDNSAPSYGNMNVGAVTGVAYNPGRISNVYSLINVAAAGPHRSSNGTSRPTGYGHLVGTNSGSLSNGYGIGRSYNLMEDGTKDYTTQKIGALFGSNNGRTSGLYYWNEENMAYPGGGRMQTSLEMLYDAAWQASVLGGQFDVTPVETGYFPHVRLSEELPEQPYIPLPTEGGSMEEVKFIAAEVVEYAQDRQSARVAFRFENNRRAEIRGITIEDLDVALEPDTAVTEDGYTTVYATVSEPKRYLSAYDITGYTYFRLGVEKPVTLTLRPQLLVDFYRNIYTADDWYRFVVQKPTENARLASDISFAGVAREKIVVTGIYTGKLDGSKTADAKESYALTDISIAGSSNAVFSELKGEITNLRVENMSLGSEAAPASRTGLCNSLNTGKVENVHMKGVTITGYERLGAFAAVMTNAEIRNSSASDVTVVYKEPKNTNTTGYVGGLAGDMSASRITNCYVRNLDMKAEDMEDCIGVGGLAGYLNDSYVENAYAAGEMRIRGSRVGGIAGYMYAQSARTMCMKNVLSKVNIYCYQNKMGGIAGELNQGGSFGVSDQTGFTGVAYGNIFAYNPQASGVSHTVGVVSGYKLRMYGSAVQLINGVHAVDSTQNTRGILSKEQMTDPEVYYKDVAMNRGVYDYEMLRDGNLPRLYYAGTRDPLPGQEENISLGLNSANEISVREVMINETERKIILDLNTPGDADYVVTDVVIEDLSLGETYEDDRRIATSVQSDPTANRTRVNYLPASGGLENQHQKHWKDSYLLTKIVYKKTDAAGNVLAQGVADFSGDPVRIPLTLYADINNLGDWGKYIRPDNNYGNYENYKIRQDISFAGSVYTKDAKLGRLVGEHYQNTAGGGMAVLSGINLTGAQAGNLIFRLNSEMNNLRFENCTIEYAGRTNSGIVGASAGIIRKIQFENITVNAGVYERAGMIGKQTGGEMNGITLKNVEILGTGSYRGGLCGHSSLMTYYRDITGENVTVAGGKTGEGENALYTAGGSYLGGMLGYSDSAACEDIEYRDVKVLGTGTYVGGVIGQINTSSGAAHLWNVKITGTPERDAENRIISSSTVVRSKSTGSGDVYAGGIAGNVGFSNVGRGRASGENALLADGIMVEAAGQRIGGAFGYSKGQDNVTVRNSYVKANAPSSSYSYQIGGITGCSEGGSSGCLAENIRLDVVNGKYAGLAFGMTRNGATSNCAVKGSTLTASLDETKSGADRPLCMGGFVGEPYQNVTDCAVINSSVIAVPGEKYGYAYVGGITGSLWTGANILRCFYYAEPKGEGSPASKPEYVVQGTMNVGGLSGGHQNNSELAYCYSNANVKALKPTGVAGNGKFGGVAGGLVGAYNNSYTYSKPNGGAEQFSNYSVSLHDNYFAGTVYAEDRYAGGAIGTNGMGYIAPASVIGGTVNGNPLPADRARGGRSKAATGERGAFPGKDEKDYTYRNVILAESVYAGDGTTAHAFCGYQDGFEGKPNAVGSTVDAAEVYQAGSTYLYSGMRVGASETDSKTLYEMRNDEVVADLRSSGTYRYKLWNKGEYGVADGFGAQDEEVYLSVPKINVRLVGTDDLKGFNQAKALRALGWSTDSRLNNFTDDPGEAKPMRADYYLMYYTGGGTAEEWEKWTDAGYDITAYQGQDYLPHVRTNSTISSPVDNQTRRQWSEGIRLPIPGNGESTARARTMSLRRTEETYGIAYPVAADKINLEFSSDLVEAGGYFTLRYGNKIVARELITKRVYTYTYDYAKNLTLAYGFAETGESDEAGNETSVNGTASAENGMSASGKAVENAVAENWAAAEPVETLSYKAADLARHIMVYGNEYYYISDEGIVHGNGSGSAEDDSGKVKDADAEVLPGDYISLYNGRALTKDGSVVDVKTGETLRQVKGLEPAEGDALPLQTTRYGGRKMAAYAKHSKVIGSDTEREAQVLQGYTGVTGVIDGALENRKDAVLLYEKGGNEYQTILGTDGVMVDLYQGDDLNAPEDFRRSGIVSMTNNLNCSVPFVLVEYLNGSIVGYNYMTGEYLFDNYVRDTLSLADYVKSYFTGDKSMYEDANSAYAGNKKLADIAGTPERLAELVTGNSSKSDIEGNSSGSGVKMEHAAEGKTEEDGEKAAGETEAAAGSAMEEGTANEAGVKSGTVDGEEAAADGAAYGEGTEAGEDPAAGLDAESGDKAAAGDKAEAGEESRAGNKAEAGEESAENDKAEADEEKAAAGDKAEAGEEKAAENDEAGADEEMPADDVENDESGADEEMSVDGTESADKAAAAEDAAGERNGSGGKTGAGEEAGDTPGAESTEAAVDAGQGGRLITVYNQSTGTYELVDIEQYFNEPVYYSENHKLNVQDFRAYAGFAAQKEEPKSADGLLLYIFVAIAVVGGVGIILRYRKVKNAK